MKFPSEESTHFPFCFPVFSWTAVCYFAHCIKVTIDEVSNLVDLQYTPKPHHSLAMIFHKLLGLETAIFTATCVSGGESSLEITFCGK